MVSETLAAAWRIRHKILKLDVARLPEKYQDLAWSLVSSIYFRALGNSQLLDPIFENGSKLQMAMLFLGQDETCGRESN
jgi:hypothetical protein